MRNMHRRKSHRLGKRRGTTVVELAIVAPLLFLLLFGAIDFSRANSIRNTAENAAYEAARQVIVPGATSQQAQDAAKAILNILAVQDATVVVTPAVFDSSTKKISVTVSVPLSSNLYAANQFLKCHTISRTCTLTREQFTPSQ